MVGCAFSDLYSLHWKMTAFPIFQMRKMQLLPKAPLICQHFLPSSPLIFRGKSLAKCVFFLNLFHPCQDLLSTIIFLFLLLLNKNVFYEEIFKLNSLLLVLCLSGQQQTHLCSVRLQVSVSTHLFVLFVHRGSWA